jgi:uncharacterized protein (TIGR03067 family)
MPKRFAVLCLVLVPLAALAAPPADEAIKKEEQKLAGTWAVISAEADGKPVPAREFRGLKMTFKDGQFTAQRGAGEKQEGTYKLAPAKNPKQIDILHKTGPLAKRNQLGIYALSGNTLKVCSFGSEKERPNSFDTRGKSGCMLMTLRREP